MTNKLENKNVLVTGGLGFIGSNLSIKLVNSGAKVTIIDNLEDTCGGSLFNIESIKDRVRLVEDSIGNDKITPALVKEADIIFNLAGKTSHIESVTNPYLDFEINCQAHIKFLNICKENNPEAKIVYASTRQIYGDIQYLPLDEKHPINPVDINGINKYSTERHHILYNRFYKMPISALRLTNTYGPRQLIKHNRYGVAGWFFNRALTGNEITLFDGGKLIRDFNYVEDVADAFISAALSNKSDGKVYNLGGEKQFTLKQFADLLIKYSGKGTVKSEELPKNLKKVSIGDSYSDYSKIFNELGWKPETSLEEGMRKTIDFFRPNLHHYLDNST